MSNQSLHWQFTSKLRTNLIVGFSSLIILQNTALNAAETDLTTSPDFFDLTLEELFNIPITTTSFFPETNLDAGSTVTVITSKYWQKRGARRLDDAIGYMPGLTAMPHFLGSKRWVVRGFPNVNGSGVQTLWDGIPINALPVGTAQLDHPNIQLDTLSSIEVIRGPGSALYGAEAFHGVVSLSAFESQQDIQKITLQAASNAYKNASYLGSFALTNQWRLNIAVSGSGQPNQNFKYQYFDNSSNLQTNERNYQYGSYTSSIKLESNQQNKISHKFGIYYNLYNNNNFYFDGSAVPENDVSNADTHLAMIKAEIKWNLGKNSDLVFHASNWSEGRKHSRILSNGNRITIVVDKETQAIGKLVYRNKKLSQNTQLSMALEIRMSDTKNAYRKITQPDQTVILNAPLAFGFKSRKLNSFLVDAKTTFANTQYDFRYGFRLDSYSDFGKQISPRLGLIKHLDKSSALKILYGNAFKAPTANELYGSPFQTGDLNLKPETINTLELVYLKKMAHQKIEIVLFSSKWQNGIRTIDTDNDGFGDKYANNADSSSSGIEASYMRAINQWNVETSVSYVYSKDDTNNLEYVEFPHYIVNLGIGYQFHNGWQIHVNNRALLDMSRSPDTKTSKSAKLKDYWRTDLNISKTFSDHWQGFINIINLLNRDNQHPVEFTVANTTNFSGGIQDEEISLDVGVRYTF